MLDLLFFQAFQVELAQIQIPLGVMTLFFVKTMVPRSQLFFQMFLLRVRSLFCVRFVFSLLEMAAFGGKLPNGVKTELSCTLKISRESYFSSALCPFQILFLLFPVYLALETMGYACLFPTAFSVNFLLVLKPLSVSPSFAAADSMFTLQLTRSDSCFIAKCQVAICGSEYLICSPCRCLCNSSQKVLLSCLFHSFFPFKVVLTHPSFGTTSNSSVWTPDTRSLSV